MGVEKPMTSALSGSLVSIIQFMYENIYVYLFTYTSYLVCILQEDCFISERTYVICPLWIGLFH